MGKLRLDRLIAEAAGLPRSAARRAIQGGQVAVDGTVCRDAGAKFETGAELRVSGRPVLWREYLYLMLDKPAGVLSASRGEGCVTVADLVRDRAGARVLFPAGRLDRDSTGFILMTDDGALAHDLLASGHHVDKVYEVRVDTPVTEKMVRCFAEGAVLADGSRMLPAVLEPAAGDPFQARVTLHQGVYHQIKRMFGVCGAGVSELRRVEIGGVRLDENLGPGGSRPLTPEELSALRRSAGAET